MAPERPSVALRSSPFGRAARGVFLAVWGLVTFLPLYYLLLVSFHSQGGYLTGDQWLPTSDLTIAGYSTVIGSGFFTYFFNSVFVGVFTVMLTLVLSILCAYRMVLNRGRGGRVIFRYFLVGLAIPVQALIVPVFLMVDRIGLYDSRIALILVEAAFSIPISVVMLVNFLRDVPHELIESMRVDGASDLRVLWWLILPLSRSVLLMLVVYDGLVSWNNFVVPLVLTTSNGVATLPLQLFSFMQSFGVNVPAALAAVSLSTLPMMLVFMFGYRYVMGGLGAGLSSGSAVAAMK